MDSGFIDSGEDARERIEGATHSRALQKEIDGMMQQNAARNNSRQGEMRGLRLSRGQLAAELAKLIGMSRRFS